MGFICKLKSIQANIWSLTTVASNPVSHSDWVFNALRIFNCNVYLILLQENVTCSQYNSKVEY